MKADPLHSVSDATRSRRALTGGTPGEDRIRASIHEAGHAVALQRTSFPAKLLNVTITGTQCWRGRVRFRRRKPSVYDAYAARELDQQLNATCCLLCEDEVAAKKYALECITESSEGHDADREVEKLLAWLHLRAKKAEANRGIVPWFEPRRRLARSLALDEALIALAGWGAEEIAFGGSDEGYHQDYNDAERLARCVVPADEVEPLLRWLAVRVRSLLRDEWWTGVDALAARLRETAWISGPEADSLIAAAFEEEDPPIPL